MDTFLRGLENYGHEYCLDPREVSDKLPVEVASTCAFSDK